MAVCGRCFKQISNDQNYSGIIYHRIADDREMSRFLYRLTQEIVTSRDFTDANINSICEKYYKNSTYRDKARLARTIVDLKKKLQIENVDFLSNSSLQSLILSDNCSCSRSMSPVKNIPQHCDKCTSAQSFSKLPGMKFNKCSQYQEPLHSDNGLQKFHTPSSVLSNTSLARKKHSSDSATNSISTITTYNFPSSMYSSPHSIDFKPAANLEFAVEQIHSESDIDEINKAEPVEGCCGKGTKKSTDSSADMAMRMAASDRLLQTGHKCPLHHCEQFGRLAASGAGLPGSCGGGCASDFPVPKLESEESHQATCCGRSVKKKKKKPAANPKQTSKKKQGTHKRK